MSYILKVHISVLMWENMENISVVKKKSTLFMLEKKKWKKRCKEFTSTWTFYLRTDIMVIVLQRYYLKRNNLSNAMDVLADIWQIKEKGKREGQKRTENQLRVIIQGMGWEGIRVALSKIIYKLATVSRQVQKGRGRWKRLARKQEKKSMKKFQRDNFYSQQEMNNKIIALLRWVERTKCRTQKGKQR